MDDMKIQVVPDQPSVRSGETARVNGERGIVPPAHDCDEHAVPYESDGALGHGFECGVCGAFLQAG